MKKTYLYDEHIKLNAKMVDFSGWLMPVSYSSLKNEIEKVRTDVGVFDVSHMGEFFVEGEDACDFIQYLLPNDFNVSVGKAMYSPLLNNDGKIIDDLIVYKLDENKVMICVNAGNIEKDWEWVKSIHKQGNYKSKLTDQSKEYSLLALQGPKALDILNSIEKFESKLDNIQTYGVSVQGNFIVARTGYTGEDGFEIFGNHDAIKGLWIDLIEKKVTPCGLGARDTLRLEVCYPLYGNELNEDLTPLDTGLKWTVKQSKESFIGKEALEKYETRYKLIKFSMQRPIARKGHKVLDLMSKEVLGEVTSGTMSPTLGYSIAMALVDKHKISDNTQFAVEIREKIYETKIHKKAFYSREK